MDRVAANASTERWIIMSFKQSAFLFRSQYFLIFCRPFYEVASLWLIMEKHTGSRSLHSCYCYYYYYYYCCIFNEILSDDESGKKGIVLKHFQLTIRACTFSYAREGNTNINENRNTEQKKTWIYRGESGRRQIGCHQFIVYNVTITKKY